MEGMLGMLKVLATVLDGMFGLILLFFCRNLHWWDKNNRASIIGFGLMILTYILNVFVIWARV